MAPVQPLVQLSVQELWDAIDTTFDRIGNQTNETFRDAERVRMAFAAMQQRWANLTSSADSSFSSSGRDSLETILQVFGLLEEIVAAGQNTSQRMRDSQASFDANMAALGPAQFAAAAGVTDEFIENAERLERRVRRLHAWKSRFALADFLWRNGVNGKLRELLGEESTCRK